MTSGCLWITFRCHLDDFDFPDCSKHSEHRIADASSSSESTSIIDGPLQHPDKNRYFSNKFSESGSQ